MSAAAENLTTGCKLPTGIALHRGKIPTVAAHRGSCSPISQNPSGAALAAQLLCTSSKGVIMVACDGGWDDRLQPKCDGLSVTEAEQLDEFYCPAYVEEVDRAVEERSFTPALT